MNPEIERLLEETQRSYERRKKEAKKVWRGFDDEKKRVENQVIIGFYNFLNNNSFYVSDRSIRVVDFDVNYNFSRPKSSNGLNGLDIEIVDWNLDNIKDPERRGFCAYLHLFPFTDIGGDRDPRVVNFMKDYGIEDISYRECGCGSDHK